jgi:hypothetical protein
MRTATMTPEAKKELASTIRGLRARLLDDLHAATESAYRLAIPRARDAGLDERGTARRQRLEAWIKDQTRTQAQGKTKRTEDDFRREAEKQAAYTLLNRLVVLRLMETPVGDREPLQKPAVLTGGWESRAYKDFRQLAPALVRGDETEGYGLLLQLVFEELATDLPGVFGGGGVADLIPIPAGTLRYAIEELDNPDLKTCWTDDMTLGWVYQYWNDPEREALDAKLNAGGKIEPHEIASKTQMFTERYMVDWLLQNSLGPMWLAMCKQHGWTPEVEADGTLARLEARRVEWRAKRDAGEVSLTELMPLRTDAERRWACYVPQPIPDDAVHKAPKSVRELKILDPAVGSGHFLVVAMDMLVALYREEARHRGEQGQPEWSDTAIVERILSENLHGIDLDPRAVQIAAATLWLKARQIADDPRPKRMNLVASNLRLANLSSTDPAVVQLRKEVERETGIPGLLTDTIVQALAGADYLGSLLKVDAAVDAAIAAHEDQLGRRVPQQGSLTHGFPAEQRRIAIDPADAKSTILEQLERFLARHSGSDDLGLRTLGEQLAAGVRVVRMVREGSYDLVVANPPYQGTSKLAVPNYVEKRYPLGKADLFAAFLLRGLQLVRAGGVSAMLTMRNWMFIKQYAGLRKELLEKFDLRALGDFAVGAFDDVPNDLLSVVVSVLRQAPPCDSKSVALQPTPPDDTSYDRLRTRRKRAATLCHVGRHEFDLSSLKVVPEWPVVYWWTAELLRQFREYPLLATESPVLKGMSTQNNARFLRESYEVAMATTFISRMAPPRWPRAAWVPYLKGGAGAVWFEPTSTVVAWAHNSLALRVWLEFYVESKPGGFFKNPEYYFRLGCAVAAIGSCFSARLHRHSSVLGHMGTSCFPRESAKIVCLLNRTSSRRVVESLNPTFHFGVGDVGRVPVVSGSLEPCVVEVLKSAFDVHESHRETSVEATGPGPSPWRNAQAWAQLAVDRPEDNPLPEYTERHDPEPATDHISFALGVALGRFGLKDEGILEPATADLRGALPTGILFLDTSLDPSDLRDSLGHLAAAPIHGAWQTHASSIKTKHTAVREYLASEFFDKVHRPMYENRPIHWPLSSASKTFVAWVNIHRFTDQTLRILIADHLQPALSRIEGDLTDIRAARDGADKKAATAAAKRYAIVSKARDELVAFIAAVEQCADKGPLPPDAKTPPRNADARYAPDLDDGVMINSAALYPLLDPQWKQPRKWWKELATAKGKQDYDWSHLAMRYWPDRVDAKCQQDPSLGVAHGCFWKYHPARAWAWELRLQHEIGPDFRIEEKPYRGDGGDREHRDAYLRDHGVEALAAVEKEALRRRGRGKTAKPVPEMRILEAGLWFSFPQQCWELELRISEKQGAEFQLRSPDEPAARETFIAANPKLLARRDELLGGLSPSQLFNDAEPDEDAAPSDEEGEADDEP